MQPLAQPSADDLAELTRLYRDVRYLDAFHYAQKLASFETWTDPAALVLAGRLVSTWGDSAASNRLHAQAWRLAPADPETIFFQAITIEHKHGIFEALRFLHEQRAHFETDTPTRYQVWLWLNQSRLLGAFRDFEGADALLRRAEPHAVEDPWWWVELARLREQQDRYDEALHAAYEALRIRPRYRQAIETIAHLLMLVNHDAEALALLQESLRQLQAGNLAQMLAILQSELEDHIGSLATLDRVAELHPRADQGQRRWLAARRSDAHRALGQSAPAIHQARLAKGPFFDHVGTRLETSLAPRRVHLRVPFVRQHHMTCAPATLTAIAAFWRAPIDHLELARVICYDGTPDHEERHWAANQGWIVREFRVTWESAIALLDRGCPFTLTTVAPRSAHLQAVVGYDHALGLLLLRDPYQRVHNECVAETFLAACASHGPRGMILVPAAEAARLDGLDLPDAVYYDRWFALRRALGVHDRDGAQSEVDALSTVAPDHLLTLKAQRELAGYDGNFLRQLETTRALLARFPDDANFLLDEIQSLRGLGRYVEARERIAALATRGPEPLFLRERAELYSADARTAPRAHRLLRRALQRRAVDASNLRAFANLLWTGRQFADATAVYRLAACVGDKMEYHWDAFFSACRHTRLTEPTLQLLRQREARLGAQSSQPVRTLFRALDSIDRTNEGFVALEAALLRRPEDGELLLFAAESYGRFGRTADSQRCLQAAANRCARGAWLRVHARLAEIRAEHVTALAAWRELLALNPIDSDAHGAIARLMSILEGRAAALAFIAVVCASHPANIPLHYLQLEWLRTEPPETAIPVVDHLLALDPGNAWAQREKALILRRQRKLPEALALAREARRSEPLIPASPGIEGLILADLGQRAEARAAYAAALALSIDAGYMEALLEAGADFAARQGSIAFIQAELMRQPASDAGSVLRFRELARGVLSPADLQRALEVLLEAQPDNWAAWLALGAHLLDQNQIEPALARVQEATERFPLVARTWVDLAAVQSRAGNGPAEIESLKRAIELSPSWPHPSRALATAHERALQLDEAEHVLRRATAADPLDASVHGRLADLLSRRGRTSEALPLIERAIALEPGYDWAWERLESWSETSADPARPLHLATEMTHTRPGDAAAWLRLARLQFHEPEAALASLERARTLEPRNSEIHDLRAQCLVEAKRFDEAAAACHPPEYGEAPPHDLLGRAAWVERARGRTTTAIEQLRNLLTAHPDYVWGWASLTEWLWETESYGAALEAATKWSWLTPWNAVPFGYAAAAQQRAGQRQEAKDLYWRALHANPTYLYGAQALLQMLAEDRQLEEAGRVLKHIETHFSPAESHRAAVLYHIMRHDRVAAGAALNLLARSAGKLTHLLDESARALTEAGWRSTIEETLTPLLTDPGVPASIGRYWVDAWAPSQTWGKLRRLARRSPPEPIERAAWGGALEHLAQSRATWRLRWIAWRRREWLRADTATWGTMGYAYVTIGQYRAAIAWLADWTRRSDVKPWMLHNLAIAHYQRRETAAAAKVVTKALDLPPDSTRSSFLAWHALENALGGNLEAARQACAGFAESALDDHMKVTRGLADVVIQFHDASAESPRVARRAAKKQLHALWANATHANGDTSLVHQRARVLRHIARVSGSWFTRVQSYLPPPGRRYTEAGRTFSENWWMWIVAFFLISQLARMCARY